MLYVSSIIHGTSLDILLPLAEYRDLEIFLNRGYDNSEVPHQQIYDFEKTFPSCKTPEFPMQVMAEFSHVVDGLRWLHDELIVGGDHDVYCAHMDLKPDNILVARDQKKCPVGKWMLSDFGLSVFKKSTGELNQNARSVRDVIQKFSPRTHARRAPDTYQAPEVQFREDKMVGRKSDVWSMICIFSEVLISTLEGKESLHAFRDNRISHGNDYFYCVRAGDSLTAGLFQEYEVKKPIIDTLDMFAEKETLNASQKAWVKCGTRVILKGLTIDQERRPDASKLHGYLSHVIAHCLASFTGEEIRCPQELLDWEQSPNSGSSSPGSMGGGDITPPSGDNPVPSSAVSRQLASSYRISVEALPRDHARRPRDRKAIALCPQGQRVGYLFADCIYVYSLNNFDSSPVFVNLSPGMALTHLRVSGSYLVAWGRSNSPSSRRTVSEPTSKVWIAW
jgi:serine/threonine protein kinase